MNGLRRVALAVSCVCLVLVAGLLLFPRWEVRPVHALSWGYGIDRPVIVRSSLLGAGPDPATALARHSRESRTEAEWRDTAQRAKTRPRFDLFAAEASLVLLLGAAVIGGTAALPKRP